MTGSDKEGRKPRDIERSVNRKLLHFSIKECNQTSESCSVNVMPLGTSVSCPSSLPAACLVQFLVAHVIGIIEK